MVPGLEEIGRVSATSGDDVARATRRGGRLGFRIRRSLNRFAENRRGTVAMMFAMMMIPLTISAGMAVDLGRAQIVKARLGYALDAAGLAVGSSAGDENELNAVLTDFFNANYPAAELGVPATPTMEIVDSEIHLAATAELDTFLMGMVGIHQIEVAVSSTIVRETKGLDVVMVLDNTGSMSGSKITSLKSAANSLVDILFGDQAQAEKLKMGVVPFAAAVNIGRANTALVPSLDENDYDPDFWRGCVEARTYPNDVRDTSVGAGGAWNPYLWESNSSNRWPRVRGRRGQIRGPNKSCPVEMQILTNRKADVVSTINAMEARGTTHINVGAMWGWRVLSPEAPFTNGAAYDDPETVKAIIVMTDGENYISSSCNGYGAYGSLCDGRLGTTSKSAAEDVLDARLLEVCSGMKNLNVKVYTITFQVGSSAARTVMRNCATDVSKYYDSPSNEDLERVFRAIGAELSNLRIGN